MKYRGNTPAVINPKHDDIIFQILDWQGEDEPKSLLPGDAIPIGWKPTNGPEKNHTNTNNNNDNCIENNNNADKCEDDDTDDENIEILDEDVEDLQFQRELAHELHDRQYSEREYKIRIFGVTSMGQSVCVNVTNFMPFLYIKPARNITWTAKHTDAFNLWLPKLLSGLPTMYGKRNYARALINIKLEMRKDFVGFRNEQKEIFFKLTISTVASLKAIGNFFDKNKNLQIPGMPGGESVDFEVFEANIIPFIRLIHQQNLNPAGWVKLAAGEYTIPSIKSKKWSRCQIEASIDAIKLTKIESADIAPFLIASFDLECTSEDGSFPNPRRKGDSVIQIGMTVFQYPEKNPIIQYIGTLGKCAPIDGVIVESSMTEGDLFVKWLRFIYKVDPDIITGYNIWGFDWRYLHERSGFLNMGDEFKDFGRLRGRPSRWIEQKLASNALGDNFLKYYDLTGRIQIDMMKLIQKDHKLDMWKLDFVAHHFMGLNKVDLLPKEIFKKFQEGSPENLKEIAIYCIQDCALCNHLMNKLEVVANNLGIANVCYVPLSWLFLRGQGVKIFSLVSRQCYTEGFCMPWIRKNNYWRNRGYPAVNDASSYEGAIVLPASPGIYMEPITIMDYGSLYPNSMIAENISHDSIVYFQIFDNDNNIMYEWGDRKYDNLPGYVYNNIEFDNKTTKDIFSALNGKVLDIDAEIPVSRKQSVKIPNGRTVCRYAEKVTGEKNVIPRILQELLKARKITRKKIELEIIKTKTDIYEGWIREAGNVLFITSEDGKKHTIQCGEVVVREDKYSTFQKKVLDGLQAAYKVTANSLYGQVGAPTSPICMKELAASTTATGRKQLKIAQNFVETEYPGAKVIYGDSVSGDTPLLLRNTSSGKISIQTIQNLATKWEQYDEFKQTDTNRREKEQARVFLEVWTNCKWAKIRRVIRHKTCKRMFRVTTHTGCVDVSEDHSLLDTLEKQLKPMECQVNRTNLLHSFPVNYMPIGQKYRNLSVLRTMSKIEAQRFYYEKKCMGYQPIIHVNENIIEIGLDGDGDTTLTGLIELPASNMDVFIYDLETSAGNFHAGIGELVVKNTDSIFCNFVPYLKAVSGQESKNEKVLLQACIDLGIKAAGQITDAHLKKPQTLNYEKVLYPFIQFAKKRYVGHLYETNVNKYYRKEMGIVLKRRDNAMIVKKIYGGMIDHVLKYQDLQAAVQYFQTHMRALLNGEVDIKELIVTKTLGSKYKDRTRIAHAVLADRIGERDPGNKPASNERIPYVFIEIPAGQKKVNLLQGDRIEHPDYIKAHPEIHLDYRQYWDCQVKTPCLQLLALALVDLPGYGSGWLERVEHMLKKKGLDTDKYDESLDTLKRQEVERLLCTNLIAEDNAKRDLRWGIIIKQKNLTISGGQLSMLQFMKDDKNSHQVLDENTILNRLDKIKIRNEKEINRQLTVKGIDKSVLNNTLTTFWASAGTTAK